MTENDLQSPVQTKLHWLHLYSSIPMRFDLIEREMKEMENKTANEKLLHPLCGFVCVLTLTLKAT